MFRVRNNTIPYVFHERFTDINYQYPTRFSQSNLSQRKIELSQTKFAIYHLVDHVSGTVYLPPFKSNVPRKMVLRNELKKHSSNYAIQFLKQKEKGFSLCYFFNAEEGKEAMN